MEKKYRDLIENIAKEILNVETLDCRQSDSLDFYEIPVWSLEKALRVAFTAGQDSKR